MLKVQSNPLVLSPFLVFFRHPLDFQIYVSKVDLLVLEVSSLDEYYVYSTFDLNYFIISYRQEKHT